MPQQFCQGQPHLGIGQVAAYAITDTDRPWLVGLIVITGKLWISLVKMAFRNELVRSSEVVISVVGPEMTNPDTRLQSNMGCWLADVLASQDKERQA